MKPTKHKKNEFEKEIEKMRRKLKTNFDVGHIEDIPQVENPPDETPTKIPNFPYESDEPTPYGWHMKQF